MRTFLAVGGYNAGTAELKEMLATAENREEFILTTVTFLRYYDFDGVALDFVYPDINDKPLMVLLLQVN